MSSATMDRYLEKTRDAARPRGTVPTRPAGELLRNSIAIRCVLSSWSRPFRRFF